MPIDPYRLKDLKTLSEKLGQVWLNSSLIEGPEVSEQPKNREEAHFIQDRMAGFIREVLHGW